MFFLALQHLFSKYPFGILFEEEAHKLVSIRNQKEKILAQEVLTWRLKGQAIWIDQEDANTKKNYTFTSAR